MLSLRSRAPILLLILLGYSSAFCPNKNLARSPGVFSAVDVSATSSTDTKLDEDDEYEYIEYDSLTEAEFRNSEWLVGTNFDNNPDSIQETWVRLVVDADGKNVAVWGDNAQGSWNLDVASQYLGISKENKLTGKVIWAATVNDYYFCSGTVRGWKFWSPASILGQWQAKRLGVDADEAGMAPWFEEEEEEASGGQTQEVEVPKVEAKASEEPSTSNVEKEKNDSNPTTSNMDDDSKVSEKSRAAASPSSSKEETENKA